MVAYSFKSQFEEAIKSERKRQTIRAVGLRRHARVGQRLQIYTGMRTKNCYKILEVDPICTRSDDIYIGRRSVKLNGQRLGLLEEQKLARADGFATVDDFYDFFSDRVPLTGKLIAW